MYRTFGVGKRSLRLALTLSCLIGRLDEWLPLAFTFEAISLHRPIGPNDAGADSYCNQYSPLQLLHTAVQLVSTEPVASARFPHSHPNKEQLDSHV